MPSTTTCDVAIVGAGLSGGLIAMALKARHPALDVRVIDSADAIGGNHVWSFFGSDVAPAERTLLAPTVTHAWRGYTVAFPAHERAIDATYYSIESETFARAVTKALPEGAVMLGRRVLGASPTAVVLADGDRIEARGVIDARGAADLSALELGWQKFAGHLLKLAEPHGIMQPMVMDARVDQHDGYRFVYCLPFGEHEMFVEDTYFSDTPDLDPALLGARIAAYATSRGWRVEAVLRRETGVLPITLGGDFETYWRSGGRGVAKAGMRAGLFQPATGYSLPDAVRLATAIAALDDLSGANLAAFTHDYAARSWRTQRFYRMLNTMMFRAADPGERWRVIQRFYTLDAALIRRFYAGRSTFADKARILTGKPPVPVARAFRALRETEWIGK